MQRDLVIRWIPSRLTQDVTLAFNFDRELSPAWKVIKMSADGGDNVSYTTIKYTGKHAFGTSTDYGGNRGVVSTFAPIKAGEKTELVTSTSGDALFNKPIPKPDEPNLFSAENKTGSTRFITFGLLSDDLQRYSPIFRWKAGNAITVVADDYRKLEAFVVSDAKLSDKPMLSHSEPDEQTRHSTGGNPDDLDHAGEPIWTQDLAKLPASTTWEFEELSAGGYQLTRMRDEE